MPLAPGRRLGPYEIVASLGAGGMGEVYEARDTRLGRTVAIKVLPEELAADPARRARFEREARAVSQLAHPHVCTLHDVGEEEGIHFLVLEHCEGETLAGRLERGALPVAETLRVGAEIAEALDAAHRQGVIHRDLKPANVVLTPSGAKLLDFGLARLAAGGTGAGDDLPTLSADADHALTAEGTVLGTYPYMAPEQVEGAEADARSDLFSLGAVLHEMATGRRAFEGRSAASIMAAVLKEEPEPLSTLQPVAPPALDHVVSRCLAKDPEERWQSAKDVAAELRWVAEAGSQAGVAAPVARRRKGRERLAWGLFAFALAAALVLAGLWGMMVARQESPLLQSELLSPEGWQVDARQGLALSPDGSRVAFSAFTEGGTQAYGSMLWMRYLDSRSAHPLAGTEGGSDPFWSPDGRHIGFFAGGDLKWMPAAGGPAQTLCPAPDPRGGAWGEDGFIVFSGNLREGLYRVSAGGGAPVELTRLDEERGEISHRWPHFLPGGKTILFLAQEAEAGEPDDQSTIEALDLASGRRTPLLRANSSMAYSPTGHLLFWRQDTLMAQSFDAGALELAGDPFPVVGQVGLSDLERASFSISRGGRLVYQRSGSTSEPSRLAWLDRQGTPLGDPGPAREVRMPQLSHDGTRVAFESGGDIWVRDLETETVTRLTFHPAPDAEPVWSPDDRWIAFRSQRDRGSATRLYRKRSSGEGEAELLAELSGVAVLNDWSPDGEGILIMQLRPETGMDLGVHSLADGTTEDLVRTRATEVLGQYSPDGRWIAYIGRLERGLPEVFVTGSGEEGGRWQISNRGGAYPRWSADGREIVYLEPGSRLMSVAVDTGATFRAGPPRLLFEASGIKVRRQGFWPFDLHPDGERILLNLTTEAAEPPPLTLVLNWPELMAR